MANSILEIYLDDLKVSARNAVLKFHNRKLGEEGYLKTRPLLIFGWGEKKPTKREVAKVVAKVRKKADIRVGAVKEKTTNES
jgi:hypothetical protein